MIFKSIYKLSCHKIIYNTKKLEMKEETHTEKMKRSPDERHTQIHRRLTDTFE